MRLCKRILILKAENQRERERKQEQRTCCGAGLFAHVLQTHNQDGGQALQRGPSNHKGGELVGVQFHRADGGGIGPACSTTQRTVILRGGRLGGSQAPSLGGSVGQFQRKQEGMVSRRKHRWLSTVEGRWVESVLGTTHGHCKQVESQSHEKEGATEAKQQHQDETQNNT